MRTTLGKQLVRAALPQKFKDRADAPFTADYIQKLTTQLAKQNPDQYIDILQRLNHIGQRVVSAYGRQAGLTIQDVGAGADVRNKVKQFNAIIDGILNDPKLTNAQKQQKVIQLGYKYSDKIKDAVVADHRARNTALYNQMQSKARGNPMQLTQLNFGDLGVRDALNRDIPYFAASPRASGASPFACWVGASSSRKGFYDMQAMTGRAGYLGKQASNATHNVPIIEQDCGTQDTGLAVKADSDTVGAVLLRSAGKYPAGSVVTQQMLQDLDDDAQIIVRSPVACKSKHGVCSKCSGLNQNGKFSGIGQYVALNASKTFIEKATQAGVGCLHPGTPVRMADGSVKPIGQLYIGDMVLGADIQGHTQPATVTCTFNSGIKSVYKYTYARQDQVIQLMATRQHKVLKCASGINDLIQEPIGSDTKWLAVHQESELQMFIHMHTQQLGNMPTVDIQVDNKDHLFVLANGMIVSNSKHVGGTGGKLNLNPQGQDQPSGMDALERLFYVPSTFKGAAVLSPVDGTVQDIRKAPQGGHYITVGTTVTYAPQARTVRVNVGDQMTAGDKLTNGIPNPATVVQYKGLGQGRRYFLQELNRTLKQNKWGVNKRNLQQFSRSFLDSVEITDPDGVGQYLPGQIVNYSSLQKDWQPRQGAVQVDTGKSRNMYLQLPALHYTIGTRITPAVQKDLMAHGFGKITAHTKQPPFKAKFIRSQSLMLNDQNWLPRMMGERLQQTLFDAAQKGITDSYDSPSYIDKVVASPYKPQG